MRDDEHAEKQQEAAGRVSGRFGAARPGTPAEGQRDKGRQRYDREIIRRMVRRTPGSDHEEGDREHHHQAREIAVSDALGPHHRASSISERIRRTLASRPVKMASPMRKWPMFNSASWGMAATGTTLSKVRPWPACGSMPFLTASAAQST